MSFSVSGSFAIVCMGLFIAVGGVYATSGNTLERVADARADQSDRFDAVHDTEIVITSVAFSGSDSNCDVTLTVNNTGSTTLALNDTSHMVDNRYQTGWRDGATVGDDADTWLWAPGQQLEITTTGHPVSPDSVAVVTKTGVTDRQDTEGRTCA